MFPIWVTIFTIICWFYLKNFCRRLYLSTKIPGPPALPFIGNGLLFSKKNSAECFEVLGNLVKQYGSIVRLWVGPDLNILLTKPEDVEILLSSQKLIDKGCGYDMVKPWLNNGLLLSTGKKWHQRRKIITPAFHFKILEQFVEIFEHQGDIFVKQFSNNYNINEPIELLPLINLYALDVICETAMGTSINAQINSNSDYIHAVKDIGRIIMIRAFDVILRSDFLFKFSKLSTQYNNAVKILHEFTDKVITERRKEVLRKSTFGNTSSDHNSVDKKCKLAFLDILLQSTIDGKPLSDLDIREEVDTFMFEGHDTTTVGIHYCLYNIAKYPQVQEKCFQEIINTVGPYSNKSATYADLCKLQYIEKVIKETLRIFPPAPIIGRSLQEEATINGTTYPIGCDILIPFYFMGHNPNLFKSPEEFRPERFDNCGTLSEEKYHTFAYVPFSAGPRNCIGQKFAMLEMKSIITRILRQYSIELTNDSKMYPVVAAEIVLRTKNIIKFQLKLR